MKKLMFIAVVLIIATSCVCATTEGAVPHLINYQGRLTDTAGNPLNGSYNLTFRIYDALSAGNLLWEETQTGVVVDKGLFGILLGSVASLNIAFDKPYFLEIKVGTEVMSPRQQITSSGYAIRAEEADSSIDSDTISGISVSAIPVAGKILPLDSNSKISASVIPNTFGVWQTKNNNTVYQAATDGFVIVSLVANGWDNSSNSTGYTDAANPPTIIRGYASTNQTTDARFNNTRNGFCMPVRKGDYWKVVYSSSQGSATQIIYWIAIGS
ncbi:MAG: hypothetical protein HZB36_04260 [Candidatus Omnitrophica bacterium]|nr:hypothetical protein [Candidatus Omnitrophota bacterium]